MVERLDTRARLLLALIMPVLLMTLPEGAGLWVCFGETLFLLVVSILFHPLRATLTRTFAGLLMLSWMFLLTIMIHGFTTPGTLLFELPYVDWYFTVEGLVRGSLFSARLVLVIVMVSILIGTADPVAMVQAVDQLLRPLEKIGVRSGAFTLTLGMAFRFIPVLFSEAQQMKKALIVRGWNPGSGILGRTRAWIPLLIPLLVSGMRRSDIMAESMVMRGYIPGKERTSLLATQWKKIDTVGIIISVVPLIISLSVS